MLRKTKAAGFPATPGKTRDFADQLAQQNNDLLEENRQLRAAFALWAKVASELCGSCMNYPKVTQNGANEGKDRLTNLVQLGNSVLQALGPVATSLRLEELAHPDFQRWIEAAESSAAPKEPSR
jgi:hypothetical protein